MSLYRRHILPCLMHLAMRSGMLEEHRRRALAQAKGAVLELGFGSSINLQYYDPEQVSVIYALELEPACSSSPTDAL